METLKFGISRLPDGSPLVLEDWSVEYPDCHPYKVVAFPVAVASLPGDWSPERGRKFRCGINFDSFSEAMAAYNDLMHGETELVNYLDRLEKAEYLPCIPRRDTKAKLREKAEHTFRRISPYSRKDGSIDWREISTVYPDGRFEMVHTCEQDDEVYVWGLWETTVFQMGWNSIREFVQHRKGFVPV